MCVDVVSASQHDQYQHHLSVYLSSSFLFSSLQAAMPVIVSSSQPHPCLCSLPSYQVSLYQVLIKIPTFHPLYIVYNYIPDEGGATNDNWSPTPGAVAQ